MNKLITNSFIQNQIDELLSQAEREDNRARQFEGCSFCGQNPSTQARSRATSLRLSAAMLKMSIKDSDKGKKINV